MPGHHFKYYRKDIDGLRAIAVIAVFIFHGGYLPNGFLGVDIFFVISGYLITRIIFTEKKAGRFSLANFYNRRIRRIIPLVLFFCLLSVLTGIFVMLPDDLENLSQSVIATILFSNNILLCITTGNYWEVINEYKPLMHTWSLGIEEQFYLLYPFLFIGLGKKRKPLLLLLILLTLLSFFLYYKVTDSAYVFYLLPFRFYELSAGGLVAILLVYRQVEVQFRFLFLLLLLALLCLGLPQGFEHLLIPLTCLLTLLLLGTKDANQLCSRFLENPILTGIGKISFSIYMWHQFLLAFMRYCIMQELTIYGLLLLFTITIMLSVFTYFFIETPFRDRQLIGNRQLYSSTFAVAAILLGASFFIYLRAGVLKDFPELNISVTSYERNMHSRYVKAADNLPQVFSNDDKIKILVYGNSFARDWTNVLRESIFKDRINIVCVTKIKKHLDLAEEADVIFLARLSKTTKAALSTEELNGLDTSIANKIWCVGTKNFGSSNGIIYNFNGEGYCQQRTYMEAGYLEENTRLKKEWGAKYIDLIGRLLDDSYTVPVFTPNCKFISQDTRHLTPEGALFIGTLVEDCLADIFQTGGKGEACSVR